MRAFGFISVIVAALVALAAGVIGYNLGIGTQVAASGTATAVAYPMWGFGFGWHPFFGLLFGILFLFLIFALIRRAVWGGRGRGYGYGPGWHGRGGPYQSRQQMLEDWHRQAHGEQAADYSASSPASNPPRPGDPSSKS